MRASGDKLRAAVPLITGYAPLDSFYNGFNEGME